MRRLVQPSTLHALATAAALACSWPAFAGHNFALTAQPQATDALGRQVNLTQPARRVVTLAPHSAELVSAAGGVGALVGVVQGTDHPPLARLLPKVGDAWQIDAERLSALRPDLIVAWLEPPMQPLLPLLRALQVPVYFSQPRKLDDIANDLEALGQLLGHGPQAEHVADKWRHRWQALQSARGTAQPQKVFLEVGRNPLYTLNRESIVNQVLEVCGAHNVFGHLPVIAPQVDVESVIQAQPDVIVIAAAPGSALARTSVADWQRYARALPAAAQPVVIDPDTLLRPGPRLLDAAETLCEALSES